MTAKHRCTPIAGAYIGENDKDYKRVDSCMDC